MRTKHILLSILASLFVVSVAYSAPSIIYQRTLLPERDNAFDLGTSTLRWRNIYGTTFYGDGSSLTGVASLDALSATTPLTYNSSTGVFTIQQSSSSTDGYLNSTDWNTFNNKVSSQWTSTSTGIYYDSGNVGIGTTSPGAKLDVIGTQGGSGIRLGYNDSTTGVNRYLHITPPAVGGVGEPFIFNTNNALTFQTDSNDRLTINEQGNVGIGTTSPGYKLQVNGTSSIGQLFLGAGTENQPSLVFGTATSTGLHLQAAGVIDVNVANQFRVDIGKYGDI